MRKCELCDFPLKLARSFEWRDDGTIISTDRTRTRTRVAILEVDEFERLFSDLSSGIGISLDRLLIQAQREIGKAMFANLPVKHLKRLPANRFFRPTFMMKLLAKLAAGDTASLGGGTFRLEGYVPGRELVIRFINPVVIPRVVGNSLGVFESVEDVPGSTVEYGLEDGDLIIRMARKEERPEPDAEKRLYLEEVKPARGPLTFERCPRCGVPRRMAEALEWHIEDGAITNRQTGRREVIVAVQSLNAILRELESELGEVVPLLIYQHQKAFSREGLGQTRVDDPGAFWDHHLEEMALRGLGYPTEFRRNGGSVSVEISNSYNKDLYAAKIAAAFEAAGGHTSKINWEDREKERLEYVILAV